MNIPRRFNFHGNASGVAAHLYWPENKMLPVQAASSLPVIGGVSQSKAGPGGIGTFLHFQSAETSAHGEYVDGKAAEEALRGKRPIDGLATKTTVTARVRGVHVGNRLTIAVANAGLVSQHPITGTRQPSIQPVDNHLEGIRVDNAVLHVKLNEKLFCEFDTLDKLAAGFAKGFAPEQSAMFFHPDGGQTEGKATTLPSSNGIVCCTLVEKMEWEGNAPTAARIEGNVLTVADFGKVYFGVMLISGTARRIVMVRLQLGSPDGGEASAADVESNGDNWPS
jgi:hypothetical protein